MHVYTGHTLLSTVTEYQGITYGLGEVGHLQRIPLKQLPIAKCHNFKIENLRQDSTVSDTCCIELHISSKRVPLRVKRTFIS